jgi:2-methylcitrate dehydratase
VATAVLTGAQDDVARLIATYAATAPVDLDARTERAAKAALIDSLAVAIGALEHRAAQAARRHAYRFATPTGSVLWGTSKRVAPELAALTNGVLLRCYDYNDFFVGKRNSGHPSDMIGGVVAAAEFVDATGAELLAAIAIGYEVVAAAFDALSTAPGGWDYTNLSVLGATCAIARLLRLDAQQTEEALAMTVIPHFASDEIESGELNARGDLTMWKRFNGSDAVRNALQACLLAQVGVEGAVMPFVGKNGFIAKLKNDAATALPVLVERLGDVRVPTRVTETYMKRWPVGSVGQSAIQAAIEARAQVSDLADIAAVRIFAEEGAYDHLVAIRKDPWHPFSRETADHSLPYIVAAAVLDGAITTGSFAPSVVNAPERLAFLNAKVTAAPAPELGTIAGGKHARAEAGYLSRVEIELTDGRIVHGAATPFPGHPRKPFSDADFAAKLKENAEPYLGVAQTERLTAALFAIDRSGRAADITALLAGTDESTIDSVLAE